MGHSANFHEGGCLVVGFFSVVVFASEIFLGGSGPLRDFSG